VPIGPATTASGRHHAPGGAEFVPELISNRSDIGSHADTGDLNGDGTPDIVVSGASGVLIFLNLEKGSCAVGTVSCEMMRHRWHGRAR
jgi:hypothetical protein